MLINLKLTEINSYDEPPIVGRANNRQFWAASRRVRRTPPRHCAQLRKPLSSLSQADSAAIRLWPLLNVVDLAGELLIGLTSPFRKSLASRTLPEREDAGCARCSEVSTFQRGGYRFVEKTTRD
jgi:hypothetical protein